MDFNANVDGSITYPRAKLTPDNSYASTIPSRRQTPRPRSADSTTYCGDDSQEDLIRPNAEKERLRNFDPPMIRRLQAFCSLYAHHLLAVALIALLQSGCALWQGFCMYKNNDAYHAFGPGVVAAKSFAGALYPSTAILLASSSRRLQTFCRNNTYLRRLPIWDLGHVIHIWMATSTVTFGTLHGICHLAGTFRHGSQILGREPSPTLLHGQAWSYVNFLCCLSGATGIALLVFLWSILLTSLPFVRRNYYEVFRWVHFLVYPLVAVLCVHGSSSLLQRPLIGYWIALPTLLVLYEKFHRIADRTSSVQATISVMDDVVKVVCFEPHGKRWRIKPGQYILLLMPPVSKMQWHPFTVSSCGEGFIELHIKCTGGWTERLRKLAFEQALQRVYLSGPFGAPAQRYSDYRQAIMIGCGIGITPMSAILQSMTVNAAKQPRELNLPFNEIQMQQLNSPSTRNLLTDRMPRRVDDDHMTLESGYATSRSPTPSHTPQRTPREDSTYHLPLTTPETRDIDFHLIVREQRNLAAFTRLFDALYTSRDRILSENLSINLSTYLTAAREKPNPSPRLEVQRPRAGVLHRHINYGRPDIEQLLRKHFLGLVARKVDDVDVAVFVRPFFQSVCIRDQKLTDSSFVDQKRCVAPFQPAALRSLRRRCFAVFGFDMFFGRRISDAGMVCWSYVRALCLLKSNRGSGWVRAWSFC
jgi:predicted ferric reductase